MGRLDRFLRLEKSRPRRADAEPVLGAGGRFAQGAPGAETGAAGPVASGMERARFEPQPSTEKAIAVLPDDGGQPFIRCRNCRTDNHLTALTCAFCEANLTTPPQRAYNEALWQRHTAEKRELQSHVQLLEASRRAADEEAQRAIRQSLTFEQYAATQRVEEPPPLGLRLARRIRDPRLRLAVLITIGAVPLYLLFFGTGSQRFFGYLLAIIVGFLFRPSAWRRLLRGGTWTMRLR